MRIHFIHLLEIQEMENCGIRSCLNQSQYVISLWSYLSILNSTKLQNPIWDLTLPWKQIVLIIKMNIVKFNFANILKNVQFCLQFKFKIHLPMHWLQVANSYSLKSWYHSFDLFNCLKSSKYKNEFNQTTWKFHIKKAKENIMLLLCSFIFQILSDCVALW